MYKNSSHLGHYSLRTLARDPHIYYSDAYPQYLPPPETCDLLQRELIIHMYLLGISTSYSLLDFTFPSASLPILLLVSLALTLSSVPLPLLLSSFRYPSPNLEGFGRLWV